MLQFATVQITLVLALSEHEKLQKRLNQTCKYVICDFLEINTLSVLYVNLSPRVSNSTRIVQTWLT